MKKIILLCTVGFLLVTTISNAQWESISHSPMGANAVKFVDYNFGVAAGNSGNVVVTTDHGKTWVLRSAPTEKNFLAIYASGASNFWACGQNGAFFRTTDAGISWIDISVDESMTLNAVFFINNEIGYAVGLEYPNGIILQTNNGGATWVKQSFPEDYFYDIFFINQFVGWAAAGGKLYKTVNGGETWDVIHSLYQFIYCINFVSESVGYFGGEGNTGGSGYPGGVWKTSDGGATLELLLGDAWPVINSLQFVNENVGWAVGSGIYKTTNGGTDWENVKPEGLFSNFSSVYVTDESSAFVCPGILQTNDGGTNWRMQRGAMAIPNKILAIDQYIVYAVGQSEFLKTTDAGLNWVTTTPEGVPAGTSIELNDLYFYDQWLGWICGNNGNIFKTENGGLDWELQASRESQTLKSISFSGIGSGWAVGTNGLNDDGLIQTTDGGNTWLDKDMGTIDDYLSVYFYNSNLGWLGSNQKLYKTTNGGADWVENSSTIRYTNAIFFLDENIGWVAGNLFYKTVDGGLNWTQINKPLSRDINSIYFSDEFEGWAAGTKGIYYTIDGGNTWVEQFISESSSLNATVMSISFSDQNHGWAVGPTELRSGINFPLILKTTNGGGAGGGEPEQRVVIDEKFDGAQFPPNSWTVNQTHQTNTWIAGNITDQNFSSIDPTNVYSAYCPWIAADQDEWLITPSFALATGAATIEFYSGYSTAWLSSATLKLLISIDGGTNWTQIWEAVNDGQPWSWRYQNVDITQYANNPNMKLAWQYVGNDGDVAAIDNVKLTGFVTVTNVEEEIERIPLHYELSQNYPNPFNPSTKISYSIPNSGKVKLVIYDVLGREVKILVNQEQHAGTYIVDFDAERLSSGVYLYRITSGQFSETRKLLLLR